MSSRLEILGAVETVFGLGSRIWKFFSAVKDAPEEVRQMCEQLQLLQKLFPEIARSTSDLINVMPLSLDIILVCLKGCESEFNTVWLAVEPLRTEPDIIWSDVLNKIAANVKWVVKTEEFEKLTKSLERAKQTLALAMLLAGMRVDSAVLDGLSSIDTKLDEYGRMIDSHLHNVHTKIAFQLEQLEYRFLQRVDVLSGAAADIHGQSTLRVTELYDSIAPGGLPQDDKLSAVQSVGSDVDFAISSSETPEISSLDGSAVENQRADIISQAMKDIKVDESVSAAFRDATQRWNSGVNPKWADYSSWPHHGGINQRKRFEELQTTKLTNQFRGISTTTENDGGLMNMPSNGSEYSTLISDGVRAALEAANLSWEYSKLLKEALWEMQDAFEICAREYDLYPEPRLRGLITELYTESFSGMTMLLKTLPKKAPNPKSRWEVVQPSEASVSQTERNLQVLQDTIAKIRRSFRKVMEEVEYLHRKELRQAHLRLREIDRKQDQVIRALEEQQKILTSLQEEHKALSLINDHQKVLQMLQQLLAKFPPPATVGAPVNAETSTVPE